MLLRVPAEGRLQRRGKPLPLGGIGSGSRSATAKRYGRSAVQDRIVLGALWLCFVSSLFLGLVSPASAPAALPGEPPADDPAAWLFSPMRWWRSTSRCRRSRSTR